MKQLIEYGCVKVSNWYLDENGKVRLDYPASIANVPGVLIIANDTEVMYVGATTHYGPLIGDFTGEKKGETRFALINKHIAEYLSSGSTDLIAWRKDSPEPHAAKADLKKTFSLKWNR